MSNEVVLLVDLSSVAHPIWHMSQSDPDPNHTSIQTVAKVRSLSSGQPHVAVCCDKGPYFRVELDPTYKATRVPDENTAVLKHQIELAKETLRADGFPVWEVKGFEADDLIGTATKIALEAGFDVLIASSDKDLTQLVGPRVRAKSLRDGSELDEAAVVAKFSVRPDQMRDYLSLVGDASDNVKGATGIGPKKAAELLGKFDSLEKLYTRMLKEEPTALGLTPSIAASLAEFESRWPTVRSLIALRDDVPLPFSEVLAERKPKDAEAFAPTMEEEPMGDTETATEAPARLVETMTTAPLPMPSQALAVREAEVLAPAPAEWERQLDPRSMSQARTLAKDLFDSRMFSAYGTPQGVLSTVMVGRELGLPAMAALRSIHNIDGKHTLSAALMVALVLKSGLAEFFEPVSFSEIEATYATKRKGARAEVKLTHTLEMARKAWPKTEEKWLASGWGKNPTDMLVSRASSRLCRMVYPDLLAGLYTPEELADMREVNGG